MRYTYKINGNTSVNAMSYKKLLKMLPSKYPEGTIVNIEYKNKKDNLINKDVKVGSNDWNIFRCTYGAQGFNLGLHGFINQRSINREGLIWKLYER